MNIFLSPVKKTGLLVIAFITSGIVLAAIVFEIFTKHSGSMQWVDFEKEFLPEIAFFISTMVLVGVTSYLRVNKQISFLVNEALDSLATGIIYFNQNGEVARHNPAAAIMLPEIKNDEASKFFIGTYNKFLSYVYDHSLDIQDQSKLALDINQINLSKLLFREVVEFNKRIVLVQFYQRSSSEIIAVMTDISMMKRHIDEVASLTEENRIMIKAIEAAGSGMMIAELFEDECTVIFSNEVLAKILRLPMESITGHPFPEAFEHGFGSQMDIIKDAIQMARKEGSAENIWLKMQPDKKKVLWYAFYILFLRDAGGKEFFVCFLSDQTQARLAQASVYQGQKLEAVAQLAGGIAHDFNNILSVIDGFSKLMRRGIQNGNDVTAFFENIDRSVQRGTQITGRLLTFGQRRVTRKTKIDICEHVKALEAFLAPMMDGEINMVVSVQDNSCYIDASPDSITQIVMSLAANARESMPDGGDLIISVAEASKSQILSSQKPVARDQAYACIQIIDNGNGMDPEILSRVYEPFFTTRDPARNSGLGMSLVYGLVKEMDALIDIKSTPEVGTSVTILIPVVEAPLQPLFSEEPVELDAGILDGKTILLVEDSADVLEMEYQLLKEAKLNVLKASDADEALRIREEYDGTIDFLLVDVTLPEMNGVELGRLFEEISPETVTVFISAYPSLGGLAQGDKNTIILAKPFIYEQLEEVLVASLNGASDESLKINQHWVEREKTA